MKFLNQFSEGTKEDFEEIVAEHSGKSGLGNISMEDLYNARANYLKVFRERKKLNAIVNKTGQALENWVATTGPQRRSK